MKERPIIFNTEMVRAILEGRKTQTRIKFQWRDTARFYCPYGKVGDRLWVRETFCEPCDALMKFNPDKKCCYKTEGKPSVCGKIKWSPSIHMPRWASRITLEITDIRVERIKEIDEEDAKAEGAFLAGSNDERGDERNYVEGFVDLWNSIYGKDAWERNDWVWVIEFKKV